VHRAVLAVVCCIVAVSVQVVRRQDCYGNCFHFTNQIKKSVKDSRKQTGGRLNVAVCGTLTVRSHSASLQQIPQYATVGAMHKTFSTHLIVPVGTMVEFPTRPFFTTFFHCTRAFRPGLYESGSKRSVRFDRSGVSFLFCNSLRNECGSSVG